jgi:beta-galactosidase
MRATLACSLACLLAAPLLVADYVWIEGESPTAKDLDVGAAGWGSKQFLSGQAWLNVDIKPEEVQARCPRDGILLGYDFQAPSAGRYEIWNRLGFEFVRSPFDWRLDAGEWKTIAPSDLTSDLMEISFWCEVAWIKMGEADLSAGKHTLQIRLLPTTRDENGKKVQNNIHYCSDALCIYEGAFRPNLWHKPDEAWQTDADKQAAAQVFEVKADAPAAERLETPLAGPWQVCRYDEQEVVDRDGPTRTLPDVAGAFWSAIPVPGDKFEVKPEFRFCHRFVYRTRVNIPTALAGRSFFLRFPSVNMIASAIVNGQFCGWTKAPFTLWECDITRAIRPGQVNDIFVVVKDAYYAFSPHKMGGKSCRMMFNMPVSWVGAQNWLNNQFDFPVGTAQFAQQAGILETPSLITAGQVYASDVFVMPSVKRKELGLQITVQNPTAAECRVEIASEAILAGADKPEKTFPAHQVTIPPGAEQVVTLAEPWDDPKLWWPDEPTTYTLVTTIRVDGKPVDVRRAPFGFREWEWNGRQFKINGVPWQFWADTTLLDGGRDPEAAIRTWRRNGQNLWRFWGRTFGGLDSARALDLMDRTGIVVRRSGIFDGQGANYMHGLLDNKALFDNWIVQLKASVREQRNHPSVLIWSLENEITFINSRNLGLSAAVEPEISRAAHEVMALDPTRPVMVDGGNCLMDNSLPVNGVHYMESYWRDYPDEAYTLARAYVAHEQAVLPTWGKCPWQLVPDRPIFMGESFYTRGSTPSAFAQFGGEGCFSGWGEYTRIGVGLYAKMLAEGYRWHGVAAQHFWLSSGETDLHYNSWKPVCVLCREWNWTFGGGGEVARTLKVFNNTHLADPIEAAWSLTVGGKLVAGEKRTLNLAPGGAQEFSISFKTPLAGKRTAGEFVLTCARGGKEVFREVKPVALLNTDGAPKPSLKKPALVVLDPFGSVKARLAKRGLAFTEVAKPDDIPGGARVIIVGKDALSPRDATDPRWVALASAGARLLVLEQANPLRFLAVPADLAPTDYMGRIAFAENLDHPAFAGLDQPDFFTWSGDHILYRNVYRKATHGAVSLIQCDEGLGCSALAECPVNDGLMLLCQMVVGDKLASDPVAARLFDNLLAYCDAYKVITRTTAVVMDPALPAFKLLADSGLHFDKATDLVSSMAAGKHDILVFDATPDNLRALAAAPEKLKAFTDRGGWLMAWGLTPEGLPDFNKIVGVEHLLRPFELERVGLPAVRDPLMSGITVRDVTMESAEQIFPWAGDKYLVDDEFTWIVDLSDVAPFCDFPGATAGDHAAARAAGAGWSRNMVNGFTSADAWKLIYYMSTAGPSVKLTLPREEEVTRFSIVLNPHYSIATKVNLTFDDSPEPVVLVTRPNNERQDFDLKPHRTRTITITLAEFDKPGQTTGIDNVWIQVTRSPDFQQRVKPMLSLGGLVRYPMGKGGLVLNQIRAKDSEPVPENLQKKRVLVSTILRNLHAVFAGGKILTTANLDFRAIPFDEQCNGYLTKDRGWFEGNRDLSHLPLGKVTFAGVPYAIRDFKTSPVPSCVMLAGPGARGALPGEVRGLKIGAKADLLFFLHTFNRVQDWRPGKPDEPAPVLFVYTIHYADGQTAQVPVAYGEGVDHWVSPRPAGMRGASVAWSAPFPGEKSDDQAVVYQMAWNSPRPGVQIDSLDLTYGPSGSRFGTPALLAITAGATATPPK